MMKGSVFTALCAVAVVWLCSCHYDEGQKPSGLDFYYDGSFDNFSWDLSTLVCEFRLDSTLSIGGKFPLRLSQRTLAAPLPPIKTPLVFSASKFIHLDRDYQNVTVTLNCRSENLDSFWLKGEAVDGYDNIVSQDSVELSYDGWRTDTLELFCKKAKYLTLKLMATGLDYTFTPPQKDQFVWFDRMELSTKGEPYVETAPIPSGKLSRRAVTGLTNPISDAAVPFDKKIVALGETIHGSPTITETQIGLIKRLVEQGRCKLIVWEYSMPVGLYWDLYIRGDVPKEKMDAIDKFAPESYSGIFPEFLNWLREYNLSHARKVKIAGNLNINDFVTGPFFYYLDAFYDDSSSEVLLPLMEMVARGRDIEEYIGANEQAIRAIMGDDNYREFMYVYSLCNRKAEKGLDWKDYRDYYMARISGHYIDTCLAEDESAVMVAHAGHVSKKYIPGEWHVHSMGQYLSERYGDDYFSVAITVGWGEFVSKKVGDGTLIQKYSLGMPVESTLEDLCLAEYDEDIWIETSRLSRPVFAYRSIGSGFVRTYTTETGNLSERFDGILFIREGRVFEEIPRLLNNTLLGTVKFTKLFRYQRERGTIAQ